MLASLSRWIREGPVVTLVPTRFRSPLERLTVSRAYPRSEPPLRWTLGEGREAAVLFGGDLALHRWEAAHDLASVFARLRALAESADALFLNLETQLTSLEVPAGIIGSSMRAAPAALGVLSYLGVRAVTCANNHCLDFGSEGLSESARLVESAGIAVTGVVAPGRDRSAVVDVRGIRVGLLGYTDDWRDSEDPPGATRPAAHDPPAVRADIAALREQADLVVVQLHWGYEWSMYPMRSHRDLARSYVEAGAHLVICHHAHVPMGVETWQGGAIAHGLGNLYFGRSRSEHHPFTSSSFVLRAGISRSGVTDLEVVPVATDGEGRLGPVSGRRAGVIEDAVNYLSSRLDRGEYLARVEESLVFRHGCALLGDLARRVSADDRRGVYERIRFLEPPRQRLLTARLRETGGALGGIGELLEDLRDGRKELASPAVAAELHAAALVAARYLARCPQKGRIP
jgi:hypothetical protein